MAASFLCGDLLCCEGDLLCCEGDLVCCDCNLLCCEGDLLFLFLLGLRVRLRRGLRLEDGFARFLSRLKIKSD
jgi:hypothetical protein